MNIKYICFDCGIQAVKFNKAKFNDSVVTCHHNDCELCGDKNVSVCHVRNYGRHNVAEYVKHLKLVTNETIRIMNGSHNSNINEELEK